MPRMPKPPKRTRFTPRSLLLALLPACAFLAFFAPPSSSASPSPTATSTLAPLNRPAKMAKFARLTRKPPRAHHLTHHESSAALAVRLIHRYFPPALWAAAAQVASCESHFNPEAIHYDSNDTRDLGLFQFNTGGTLQEMLSLTNQNPSDLSRAFDPVWNVRAAALLYHRDGWSQWSCAA